MLLTQWALALTRVLLITLVLVPTSEIVLGLVDCNTVSFAEDDKQCFAFSEECDYRPPAQEEVKKAVDSSYLVRDKRLAMLETQKYGSDWATYGEYVNEQIRTPTLRDSGRGEALLFARNTNFRFTGDIGFYLPELAAALIPNDPSQPVVFDDPQSFKIKVLNGQAVLSGTALTALLGEHVFNFPGATIRNLSVKTGAGSLTLSGEMIRRELWVPFSMVGGIVLEEGHILIYHPTDVKVDGKDATPILAAANVELEELLAVKAPGAVLIDSTIYLDAYKLFPPPTLLFAIAEATLEDRGLVLTFETVGTPEFPEVGEVMNSGLIVRGGDVKIMRAMPVNVQAKLINKEGYDLDFCLYDYREQVIGGYLKFLEDGTLVAYLKNYDPQKFALN